MKAMLSAFVAIAIIAVASNVILDNIGFSAQERTANPSSVRLD